MSYGCLLEMSVECVLESFEFCSINFLITIESTEGHKPVVYIERDRPLC